MHPMSAIFPTGSAENSVSGASLTGCGVTGSPNCIQISEPTLNAGHCGASGQTGLPIFAKATQHPCNVRVMC